MSVRRALKVAFIFSILVLVACTANKGLDMVVDVKFFHADGTAKIHILNEGQGSINILDDGYKKGLPDSVGIRLKRVNGDPISNQADDPDGWWRPSFLSSQIILPENQKYISLRPNEQIVAAFELERIIRGMRNSAVETDQLCEYQLRLDLQYEDLASGSATFLSGWKSVDCRSIFGE